MRRWCGALSLLVVCWHPSASAAAPPPSAEDRRNIAFEAAQAAVDSAAGEALSRLAARYARGIGIGPLSDQREALIARQTGLEKRLEAAADTRPQGATPEDMKLAAEQAREAQARTAGEFSAVSAQLSALSAEIRAKSPDFMSLLEPRPLPFKVVQSLLAPNEGLVFILDNEHACYVWAVTPRNGAWVRVELTHAALAELVSSARDEAVVGMYGPQIAESLGSGSATAAFALYDKLIRPVEPVLEGIDTLIVVPTGPLTSIPPAMFRMDPPSKREPSRTRYLIDRYALATLPAVSSLRALRCVASPSAGEVCRVAPRAEGTPPPASVRSPALFGIGAPLLAGKPQDAKRSANLIVRGLADPAQLRALPYLPGAAAELASVKVAVPDAVVLQGPAATETALKTVYADALLHARNIIFSTHGLLAGAAYTGGGRSSVAEPGLVLTPPRHATEEDDGFLSASEVAAMRMSADFVVLSACNTAASDGSPGADGLSGLARAFFLAGARSVLASHWSVNDAATSRLIIDILTRDTRSGRAKAVQSAMTKLRQMPGFESPAYWAAFALIGDPAS